MAKRGTRKVRKSSGGARGLASRVFSPVGKAVNLGANMVKNVFNSAKSLGRTTVKGVNKITNNVKKSIANGGRRRAKRATRRRKN